jgi:hypothetical protein
MRREVPVIITFIVGTIMLLSNFITVPMEATLSPAWLRKWVRG